jgi:hypothetical protein
LLLAAALCALALLAPAAGASGPANNEYKLNIQAAGGGGGGPKPPAGQKSGANDVGSSQGDSALPALLIGVAAIAGIGAGYAYVRRRRSGHSEPQPGPGN